MECYIKFWRFHHKIYRKEATDKCSKNLVLKKFGKFTRVVFALVLHSFKNNHLSRHLQKDKSGPFKYLVFFLGTLYFFKDNTRASVVNNFS